MNQSSNTLLQSSFLSSPKNFKGKQNVTGYSDVTENFSEEHDQRSRSTIEGLKLEISMWQNAYRDAQTKHAETLQRLIEEGHERENEMKERYEQKRDFEKKQTEGSKERYGKECQKIKRAFQEDDLDKVIVSIPNDALVDEDSVLREFRQMREGIRSYLRSFQDNHTMMKNNYNNQQETLKKLKLEVEDLRKKNDQLLQKELDSQDKILYLEQEKAKFDLQNSKLQKELNETSQKIQKSNSAYQNSQLSLQRELDEIRLELKSEREKNLRITTQNMDQKTKISSLEDDIHGLRETKSNLQKQIDRLTQNVHLLQTQNMHQNEEVQKLSQNLNETTIMYDREQNERVSKDHNLEKLEKSLFEARRQLRDQEHKANKVAQELNYQIQNLTHELNSTKNELSMTNEDKSAQLSQLEKSYQKMIEMQRQQLLSLNEENKKLKVNHHVVEDHQDIIARLSSLIASHLEEGEQNYDPMGRLEELLKEQQSRINALKQQLIISEGDRKSSTLELRNTIARLQFDLREKDRVNAQFKNDLEKAIQRLEDQISSDAKMRDEERKKYQMTLKYLQSKLCHIPQRNANDQSLEIHLQEEKKAMSQLAQQLDKLNKSTELLSPKEKISRTIQVSSPRFDSPSKILNDSAIHDRVEKLMEARNRSTLDEKERLEHQLNAQKSEMDALVSKYKTVKEKYIRQSLRQNELLGALMSNNQRKAVSFHSPLDESDVSTDEERYREAPMLLNNDSFQEKFKQPKKKRAIRRKSLSRKDMTARSIIRRARSSIKSTPKKKSRN